MIRSIVLAVMLASSAHHAAAQTTLRLELGMGAGVGGVHAGTALRAATGLTVDRWGGALRASGHSGKQIGSLFGYPIQEDVVDVSGLVTYGLVADAPHRWLVGVGLGVARGERLDPRDSNRLVDIPDSWGLAFELTWHGGDGRGFGGAVSAQGHLNGEASYVALLASVTFGLGL